MSKEELELALFLFGNRLSRVGAMRRDELVRRGVGHSPDQDFHTLVIDNFIFVIESHKSQTRYVPDPILSPPVILMIPCAVVSAQACLEVAKRFDPGAKNIRR